MKTKTVIAMVAAVAVIALAWSLLWVLRSDASGTTLPATARADAPAAEPGAPAIVALEEENARESAGRAEAVDANESRSAATAPFEEGRPTSDATLRGRVLDAQGRSVAGVGIFVGPLSSDPSRGIRRQSAAVFGLRDVESASADGGGGDGSAKSLLSKPAVQVGQSGREGRFELDRLPDGTLLHARGEAHVPVLAFDWYGSDPDNYESILVVAPPSAVAGVVVDEKGRPIGGVEIAVQLPVTFKPSLGLILDRAEPLEYFVRSGADGRFEIADAPGVAGRLLVATLEGSPSQGQPIAAESTTEVRVVFQLGQQEYQVAARGTVVDAKGLPASDASVRLGAASTRAAADGRFVLDATGVEAGLEILAAKPGFAPGRVAFDPQAAEFVVRLGAPALHLAGRVVDGKGRPIASVEVRALGLSRVEGIALEDMATWDGPGPFTQTDTDAEGRFVIGGLEPRPYVLGLLDRRSMRTMQSSPIQAGKNDAEIRFDAGDATGKVAGRVVDRAGEAVPGAEVWLTREIAREGSAQTEHVETFAKADGEGQFEFQDVALDVHSARVAFPNDLSFEHTIGAGQDLAHLVFVAYRRAHLQIDLAGSDMQADAFGVVDKAGVELPIAKYEGNVAMSSTRWPIADERSDVLTALDIAETVVFYYRNVETGRVPARLVPGELVTVRP